MAVPKKRTSILKKRIRKNIWKNGGGLGSVEGGFVSEIPFNCAKDLTISEGTGVTSLFHFHSRDFFLPFELVSIILLVALIGAIAAARQ